MRSGPQRAPLGDLSDLISQQFTPPGLGWLRDNLDHRDFHLQAREVQEMLHELQTDCDRAVQPSPLSKMLAFWPPVEDQQTLATSSVHACISLVQYFESCATGRLVKPSRLFLYHTARQLMQCLGDTGVPLRTTIKAMVRFGMPPERLWPYDVSRLDEAPCASLYAYASRYTRIRYVRMDPPGVPGWKVLERVKRALAAGFPCMFGFLVHDELTRDPHIPWPTIYNAVLGGQAAVAVAYHDEEKAAPDRPHGPRGCLVIRNSWGSGWGDSGYGYLPYDYVVEGRAADFWTLVKPEWIADCGFKSHPFAGD